MASKETCQAQATSKVSKKRGFPEVVLLKIFRNLSIHDLGIACLVCKQWNGVIRGSNVVWDHFVPKWPWFEPPPDAQGAYQIVKKLWKKKCVRVANERWLANPMPELVRYIKRLQKAEFHYYYRGYSSMTLVARLNPCYEFTTKGKDSEDETMNKVCEEIWNNLGNKKNECHFNITSHLDIMTKAKFLTRKEAMTQILRMLEPRWFLQVLELEPCTVNQEGSIVCPNGYQEVGSVPEELEEGDVKDIGVSPDRTIFGPYHDRTSWKTKINTRLPVELYNKVRGFFANGSENFIQYYLNDGYWNENFMYEYSLLISDTAVFHYKKYYDL